MAAEKSASSWNDPEAPCRIVDYSSDDEEPETQGAPGDRHLQLEAMGFSHDSIERALQSCGNGAPENALIDFMLALEHEPGPRENHHSPSINGPFVSYNDQQNVISTAPDNYVVPDSDEDSGGDMELEIDLELEEEESDKEQADADPTVSTLKNMGFSSDNISAAMQSCGDKATLENLIAFLVQHASSNPQEKDLLSQLLRFGYGEERSLHAIKTCGSEDVDVLVDFMAALEKEEVDEEPLLNREFEEPEPSNEWMQPRAPEAESSSSTRKRRRAVVEQEKTQEPAPKKGPLTGFGLPGEPCIPRTLTDNQARRPFFYFENVRSMPKGEWESISRFLFDIEPEFVCARYFSVARRPRGYVHNLPLTNRKLLLPVPPKTIREFLPNTVQYTPSWDTREQLHCINTSPSAASICRRIEETLSASGGEPSPKTISDIMFEVRKWNLVWTGPGICSSLEPHEMERALGYDEYHTRVAVTTRERYKSLGNAFQVDVVGYHLSALKPLFPNGIRVLSLFSGIGGAEVALHRAGIPLKFVVSVESEAKNRMILSRWWSVSGQTGVHRFVEDVQDLVRARLVELMEEAGGGFDLVIGGSPCNNMSGNNRVSRHGTEGELSALFYEFPRILNLVRALMR